jgi:hypothetical protein
MSNAKDSFLGGSTLSSYEHLVEHKKMAGSPSIGNLCGIFFLVAGFCGNGQAPHEAQFACCRLSEQMFIQYTQFFI